MKLDELICSKCRAIHPATKAGRVCGERTGAANAAGGVPCQGILWTWREFLDDAIPRIEEHQPGVLQALLDQVRNIVARLPKQ